MIDILHQSNDQKITDQINQELIEGTIHNYEELQKRKAELLLQKPKQRDKTILDKRQILVKAAIALIILAAIAFACKFLGFRAPIQQTSYNGISAYVDPLQTTCTDPKPFIITKGKAKCTIMPQADYKLVTKVQSKLYHYSFEDWSAELGPFDLALSWGKLVDSQYDRYISYFQSGRAYYAYWKGDCPISENYIFDHSANTHMIPANPEVYNGLNKIVTGDIIYMEGSLVYVYAKVGDQDYEWNSSLSRNDRGDSCEVFYIKRIQIGSMNFK